MDTEMKTETKEYYEHSVCEKEEITESIFIECENCINYNNQIRRNEKTTCECNCYNKETIKTICKKCYEIENKINSLKDEIDETMFQLSYKIKQCVECGESIDKLYHLSVKLRQYNRMLIEKN